MITPDALREEFSATRGYWNDIWEQILQADPDFFAAYLKLSSVPTNSGPLDPKVKEFIYVAVDGAATHLYEPGLRIHIRRALELGASREELLEVLQLTSTLGIHACNVGLPLLLQSLRQARLRNGPLPLTPRQEQLKADFAEQRGYWNPIWEGLLELDPDFFESYLEFSALPWKQGVLEPKVKELIYIAFDVAATHMFEPGLKLHIDNALRYGASAEEILEVFEIASTLGIHAVTTGLPILLDELERARQSEPAPVA